MALDPTFEARALDEILSSPDDPDTKRSRIAMLYEQPAANDPSGWLPPEAVAQFAGGGGAGGVGNVPDAPPGNVPDVPVAAPGAGGASGAPGTGGSGGTLGMPPPEVAAQGGTSGNIPMPLEESLPRPAPARTMQTGLAAPVTQNASSPLRNVPKIPKKAGAPEPTVPSWLAKEMGAPENYYGKPDPIGRPVTKPEDAAYRALESEQFDQTREQAEAERQAMLAGAQAEVAAVERGQIVDAELAKREMERQRQLEKMEQGFGEMLAEANREPIDSERLWNNKSTGEKILSKLALFIGTIGGAGLGNPMMMMNKIDGDVERDLQAQKANKAFQLQRMAAEGTLYGMARDRFASEGAVDQAMRETAWRKIDAELKNFHARAQDPARRAAIEQLMAATESKILDQERQRRLMNDADTLARLRASMAPRGKPPPRNEAKGLIETLGVNDKIIKLTQRLKGLTSSWTQRTPGSTDKAAAETLRVELMTEINKQKKAGTFDEGTTRLYEQMIGTPEDLFRSAGSEAKLDQLIQIAGAEKQRALQEFETLQGLKTGPPTKGAGAER